MTTAEARYHCARISTVQSILQSLTLPRPLATRLLFEAQKSPETEVCGFVGSRDDLACNVYPVRNVADDPEQRFLMDPSEQVAAIKTMRERGETMLAIYHSHPHTPPEPSAEDIRGIGYPDAVLLIISLNIKGVLEMRAWRLQDDHSREIPLQATD